MVVRPPKVVFLIGGGKQLHGGTAVLLVHLSSSLNMHLIFQPHRTGTQFSLLVLENFPAGRGQSFGVQIKVVVVMFYISYLKENKGKLD